MMQNFEFQVPTKVIFGKGVLDRLPEEAAKYGKRVLLVYGGGSIKKTGLCDAIKEKLAGFTVFELGGVESNPRLSKCHEGIEICKKENIELIIAAGGGSVMDSGKCIALGAKYDGDVWDFYEKKATPKSALPLACIPTLTATSSEYNNISVISNVAENKKYVLADHLMCPKFSIMDPQNVYSVPTKYKAYGYADSIVHACDHYLGVTDGIVYSDYAGEGIVRTFIECAPIALKNPTDYDSHANLMWAGAWAMTTIASRGRVVDATTHMLEHEISAYYDIPHGLGIAIVWPNWARYVYRVALPQFKKYAINVWKVDPAGKSDEEIALEGINRQDSFFRNELGIPKTLSEIGVPSDKFGEMAQNIVNFRGNLGYYKQLGVKELTEILERCL